MAISLGSIVVELVASVGSFIEGMDKATYAGKKATKEIHKSFDEMGSKIGDSLQGAFASLGQFGNVVGELSRSVSEAFDGIGKGSNGIAVAITALGALGAAAIAAGAGFLELGKSGAELVEHLNLISQKTGISVRDLQIFEAAGKTVGVSLDDMVVGLRRFDQAISGFGKGAAAQGILRELGVTAKDNKEALLQTADAFSKMQDPVRRANDAVALFGKSGLNMIPILLKGREGILEWEKAVDTLGPKIGKEQVADLEANKKAVGEMSLAWDKFKVQVETSTLPALSKMTSWFANNFQAMKAGLAGGFGAAAILKEQQSAQQAATEETKKQSSTQDELLRKGEELQALLQKKFQTEKDGGQAGYALDQARQQLNDAVQNGLWKQASAIQAQLPALQAAADLEAQRVARAKQLAASYASVMASIAHGPARPFLPEKPSDPMAGIEKLFGPQPKKNPLEGAPDLGSGLNLDFASGMALLKKDTLAGQDYINDFYSGWENRQQKTEESITDGYNKQFAKLLGLYALGEVSQKDFNDVSVKLEAERQADLKQLRQQTGTSTFKDAWQDMFVSIQASGKDFARSITSDISDAINSLNAQLTKFITTGKGLSIKSIGQSLEGNLTSSLLKKGESMLSGSVLGGLFGIDATKPDGSTAQNALWVQMSAGIGGLAGAGAGMGSLPLGNMSGLISLFGGSTTTGATIPGSSSGGGGGLFGGGGFLSLLSGIIPFLADGGDTQPGRAYVVGEKRPELFVPRSAGTIVPNTVMRDSSGKSTNITFQQHIHGVSDADSFKRSQTQISSAMGNALQRGAGRLGR